MESKKNASCSHPLRMPQGRARTMVEKSSQIKSKFEHGRCAHQMSKVFWLVKSLGSASSCCNLFQGRLVNYLDSSCVFGARPFSSCVVTPIHKVQLPGVQVCLGHDLLLHKRDLGQQLKLYAHCLAFLKATVFWNHRAGSSFISSQDIQVLSSSSVKSSYLGSPLQPLVLLIHHFTLPDTCHFT